MKNLEAQMMDRLASENDAGRFNFFENKPEKEVVHNPGGVGYSQIGKKAKRLADELNVQLMAHGVRARIMLAVEMEEAVGESGGVRGSGGVENADFLGIDQGQTMDEKKEIEIETNAEEWDVDASGSRKDCGSAFCASVCVFALASFVAMAAGIVLEM